MHRRLYETLGAVRSAADVVLAVALLVAFVLALLVVVPALLAFQLVPVVRLPRRRRASRFNRETRWKQGGGAAGPGRVG